MHRSTVQETIRGATSCCNQEEVRMISSTETDDYVFAGQWKVFFKMLQLLVHLEDLFQPQQGTFKRAHHWFSILLALSSVGLTVDEERVNQYSGTRNISFATVNHLHYPQCSSLISLHILWLPILEWCYKHWWTCLSASLFAKNSNTKNKDPKAIWCAFYNCTKGQNTLRNSLRNTCLRVDRASGVLC